MFKLTTQNELYCMAEGNGHFFAKKGSMVAQIGAFQYEKRLLGTNDGNVVGQLLNHVARRVTGENLEMMEVKGQGKCFLADQSAHVTIITLEPSGAWADIKVESEDLLAFTDGCHYGVTPVGTGVISQKGLFMSKVSYKHGEAQVAVKTNGNPLVLQVSPGQPVRVDPDAVVAWTGGNPSIKTDLSWKMLIGQTSGESYQFEFNEPGQFVIVQPYERESGLKIGIDDKRYQPETQSSAYQNTVQGMFGGIQGQSQLDGQSPMSGLGGVIGNIFK